MSELEVPDEAVEEIRSCLLGHESHDDAPDADCVRAIAAPVAAADYRRMADIVPVGPARTLLLNRADELDGGAS